MDHQQRRQFQKRVIKRYLQRLIRPRPKTTDQPFAARTFLHSVGFALEGLWFAFSQERNLRLHVLIQLGMGVVGLVKGLPYLNWILLLEVGVMILFAELANTILEWLVDLLTEGRYDIRAKRIKDMAAGTCLLVAGVGYTVMLSLLVVGP
jgi:undecaprenol kinase